MKTSCVVQLSQKKTALQFKALDQTLQTFNKDTGQKVAVSYRCADLDRIVPTLMGVSKVPSRSVLHLDVCSCTHSLPSGEFLKVLHFSAH